MARPQSSKINEETKNDQQFPWFSGGRGHFISGGSERGRAQFANNEYVKNIYVGINNVHFFQQKMAMGSSFNGSPGNITFNGGWIMGGNIGYRFSDFFAAELDTGVIWNFISQIGNQGLSSIDSSTYGRNSRVAKFGFHLSDGSFQAALPHGIGLGPALGVFMAQTFRGRRFFKRNLSRHRFNFCLSWWKSVSSIP